jgi:toxin FitB
LAAAAEKVLGLFVGRILPFDSLAAPHFADIMEMRRRIGRRVGEMDPMIAAIARSRGFALATRNTVDFDDNKIQLVNPWQA